MRKIFNSLFRKSINSNTIAISINEETRLRSIPRYHRTSTSLFDVPVEVNDTCTLLGDINDIIKKEIYKFSSSSDAPVIIDCGANIGISVLYFKRLYPRSRVIAYEPDPNLFEMLSTNISNFSFENVELNQRAVWVNGDGITFRSEGGHSGRISENNNDINLISVPTVRLKKILESIEHIDMLKMDIEGAEAEVLFDCGASLDRCTHIFIEYHSQCDKKQQLHDILKLFSDMGYRYHVHEAFVRKHPFVDTNCMIDMDLQLNLFFVKE